MINQLGADVSAKPCSKFSLLAFKILSHTIVILSFQSYSNNSDSSATAFVFRVYCLTVPGSSIQLDKTLRSWHSMVFEFSLALKIG